MMLSEVLLRLAGSTAQIGSLGMVIHSDTTSGELSKGLHHMKV